MDLYRFFVFGALAVFLPMQLVMAAQTGCDIERFQGASQPQGAVAHMRVVNNGRACVIVNHGVPADRTNPAETGTITRKPAHGTAEFVAPEARYSPATGYVGEDEFEYEAFAQGRAHERLRLKVRVKVVIVAP
jgi:hypothetical protein